DIEAELRNVEKVQAHTVGRRLVDAMESSNEILECYRRIHSHLERLTEARLAGMLPAKSAIYNSADSDDLKRGICAPGTREPQINLLLEWARDPESGRTCWMNGMAGTGKTTIAYTVCNRLDETFELGASFFCSRVIPECRRVKLIIPSIAYQLARFSFPFRCALVKVLESDPDAHSRALKIQYQKLIVNPLLKIQQSLPADFIVVIDALDECEDESNLGQILDLLLSPSVNLPIRFLLSSRPEPEICRRMGQGGEQGDIKLVLHDLDSDVVKSDIEAYIRHELKYVPLTTAQWSLIIERCGVLFIYASTTCRYIRHEYNMDTLHEALDTIAATASISVEHGYKNAMDDLYLMILTAAFDKPGTSQENKRRMKDVLETVICAVEPMTLGMLADLLGLRSTKQVDALLQPLRSVLNITESTGLVTTLHASFPDFMLSLDRSTTFYCNRWNRHTTLGETCLQMIEKVETKFNICGLLSSYCLDVEVQNLDTKVRRAILPGLLYACRYWSSHLYLGEYRDALVDLVRNFFSTQLLIWMEILNLTGRMSSGASIIRDAEKWCS
ncbi:hypothetical protein FRC11_008659, partial [Ceratobasidium sp. 423]